MFIWSVDKTFPEKDDMMTNYIDKTQTCQGTSLNSKTVKN